MSNKYKEQAQDILTAVGGVENIVDATYDTKCIIIICNIQFLLQQMK